MVFPDREILYLVAVVNGNPRINARATSGGARDHGGGYMVLSSLYTAWNN